MCRLPPILLAAAFLLGILSLCSCWWASVFSDEKSFPTRSYFLQQWMTVAMAGLLTWAVFPVSLCAQDPSLPHITSVRPDPLVGSIDWKRLTIQGRGFEKGFAVRLCTEGVESVVTAQDRLTYIDAQTVKVRAVFGTAAADWEVQVINPDSVASNAYTFLTEAPPPRIDALRPLRRVQNGEAFVVTVQGATFAPYSTVRWNGEDLSTTPIKSSPKSNAITIGLEAEVPASAVEGPGRNAITVHTPSPGGGTSPPKFLTVTPQPFYQTTWFYLGIVVVIVLFGAGLHWLRLKHVRERELEQKVEQRTEALQEEKEKTEEQARRLEELHEARSRLFTNLSHELRTPLTMIDGPVRSTLHEAEDDLPEGAYDQLQTALRNTERLEDLVDQVFDLAQLETGRLELESRPGDLVAFAREVARSFEPMAERNGLQFHFRADPDQIPTVFDPEKLRSVLGNLLENALKYTPDGGKVLVRVERPDEETAAVHVSDTGPGIPEDEIANLFDRFHQGDVSHRQRADGSGLGLSMAKEFVELHGGTIEVESEPGMGSIFTVSLPIQAPKGDPEKPLVETNGEETTGASTERETDALLSGDVHDVPQSVRREKQLPANANGSAVEAGSPPSILIVEDNAEICTYLQRLLSDTYVLREARDGTEALQDARATPPDLILSDVMMPGMDGLELCRRVKSDDALSDIPVVLLTAKAGGEAEVEGLDTGADAYVEKPFSMETLRARIETLLEPRRTA